MSDDEIVASIYGAVLDRNGWNAAMGLLTRRLDADEWNLLFWDRGSNLFRFMFTSDLNRFDKELRLYGEHFGAIDPRRQLAARLPPGHWLACNQHFDERFVDRDPFYQDYLIPIGFRYVLGGTVYRDDRTEVMASVLRVPGRPEFSLEEFNAAQRLVPHLAQAASMFLRTEELRAKTILADVGLERSGLAIIATDEAGHVGFCSKSAEDVLVSASGALRIRAGVLRTTGREDARFKQMLSHASQQKIAGSLRLGEGGEELLVNVIPFPDSLDLPYTLYRCSALLLITYASGREPPSVRQLAQLFGLSPAEAKLARALSSGVTPDEYAASSGVSLNTVRTQLQHIRAKTGLSRVADIARVLAGIPAVKE